MTLIVCGFVPNGIVLAGDSRSTALRTVPAQPAPASGGQAVPATTTPWILSDSTRKVFILFDRLVLGTWGNAFATEMPVAHHVSTFCAQLSPSPTTTVEEVAHALRDHFRSLDPALATGFFLAGYDAGVPHVYEIGIAQNAVTRKNAKADGTLSYGISYGGDWDIVGRLFSNAATTPPFNLLNLQDAIDLAKHIVRTTIEQMKFEPRFPTVGGHIDIAALTPNRARFLSRKELHA